MTCHLHHAGPSTSARLVEPIMARHHNQAGPMPDTLPHSLARLLPSNKGTHLTSGSDFQVVAMSSGLSCCFEWFDCTCGVFQSGLTKIG